MRGSPSFLRRCDTVTRGELVNGSAFSSQASASRSSAEITPPPASMSTLSTANSFGLRLTGVSPRVTSRRKVSRRTSPQRYTSPRDGALRFARAFTRATSSGSSNGLAK